MSSGDGSTSGGSVSLSGGTGGTAGGTLIFTSSGAMTVDTANSGRI